MGGHGNKGSITKPICDPNSKCEKLKTVIPKSKTKAEAVVPQQTTCDRTPELSVGASSQLSTRAARAALLWKTLQHAEVLVHVPCLADLVGEYSPSSGLVATKAAGAHSAGRADPVFLPVGGHLPDLDPEGLDHVAAGGEESGAAPGTGGQEERGEREEQEEGLEE